MRRRGVAQPRRKEADSRAFGVQSTRTCLSSTRPCCTAPPRRVGNVAHPPRCPPVRQPDRFACSKPQSRTRSSREATSGHGAVSCGRSACGDAHALVLQRSAALSPPAGAGARAGSQPKPGQLRSSPHRLRGALLRRSIAEQSSPRSAPNRRFRRTCRARLRRRAGRTEARYVHGACEPSPPVAGARRAAVGTSSSTVYLRRRRRCARRARAHRKRRRPRHASIRVRNQRLRAAAAVGMCARAGFGHAACRRLIRSWRLGTRVVDRSMPAAQPWRAHGAHSSHRLMDRGRSAGRTHSAAPGQASSTNRIGRRLRAVFACLFAAHPALTSGALRCVTLTEHSVCETPGRPG